MAVSPFFKECLESHYCALTFRITQVLTRHSTFKRFKHKLQVEETPGCHHCVNCLENTVKHLVEVCSIWAKHRVLVEAIDGCTLSLLALVQVMVKRGGIDILTPPSP